MTQVLEAIMLVSFGASWPFSIVKSYRSRSTKGKSLIFLLFLLFGYSCGIWSKLMAETLSYVVFFYVLNLIMVAIDTLLFLRNKRIEGKTEDAEG